MNQFWLLKRRLWGSTKHLQNDDKHISEFMFELTGCIMITTYRGWSLGDALTCFNLRPVIPVEKCQSWLRVLCYVETNVDGTTTSVEQTV